MSVLQDQDKEQDKKQKAPGVSAAGRIRAFGIGGVVLLALLAVAIVPRVLRDREAAASVRSAPATHPIVSTTRPAREAPSSQLVLPGNVEPLYTANLFARIDGYLDHRRVDIGSAVRAGEVLAVIAAPEVDQQLNQSRAALAQAQTAVLQANAALGQARANAELARLTRHRDIPLGERHAISQQLVDGAVQSYDARLADVAAAEANIVAAEAAVKANQAGVAREEQMQGFERITAPFDGVITARNVERGDLVSRNSPGERPLFSIAQSRMLRIYVDVPQSEAVHIQNGDAAVIEVPERLGRSYKGLVTRSASSLDSAARTMRTEVQLDNRDASLLPGMYSQVHFTLPQRALSLILPTTALVINQAGTRVAVVDAENRVHFLPVTIGRDMGKEVEILSGLRGDERLVTNPSDLLNEGEHVQVQ